MALTLSLFLTFSILLIFHQRHGSASDDEIRSLLEFRKGIKSDPPPTESSPPGFIRATPPPAPDAFHGRRLRPSHPPPSSPLFWTSSASPETSNSALLIPLKFLQNLTLSGNSLSGRLVPTLGSMSSLQLQGDVKELIPELRNVEYLDLSGNMFSGSIELSVENVSSLANTVDAVANLQVLRFGNNRLFGSIQGGLLQGEVPLVELDLSGNEFFGPIPQINSTTLSTLNLSANSLSGLLPPSIGHCRIVDLSRNDLSDDISTVEKWNTDLEILDLSSNTLTGSIPDLSQFQKLTFLSFQNNSLNGNLPLAVGSLQKLLTVDLSSNRLDGLVPHSLFTSVTLTNLNLSGNLLTGPIPLDGSHTSELLVLSSSPPMESLDLSNNLLTGGLPSGIGNWVRLKLLNLAFNNLSGHLPNELSRLIALEYLNLSHNHFNGNIPDKLPSSLKFFDVSYNNLLGKIPKNLHSFPDSSFTGNNLEPRRVSGNHIPEIEDTKTHHHSSKSSIRVAIILASVGAVVMIAFVIVAYRRARFHDFPVRGGLCGQTAGRDTKAGRFSRPSLLSFSNDNLLTSTNSRTFSGQLDSVDAGAGSINPGEASSSRFVDTLEPITLDVCSPDRFAGELYFLDSSIVFTAEELSRAPAEVLGRSSHGTLYKATLDDGHMLTVKWLRVGLVKQKKDFAKEAKKIGAIRHQSVVPLRAYYWGPREQERLILADYIVGDSLALHLYETTPSRYKPLSFIQRLKVAMDIARGLMVLHDKGLPHGNLKPTNVLLVGPEPNVRLTDYGLHRLMTPAGIAEQILNLGALGYRAPELANVAKPSPSFKADVYAFGVILMELLTRRSAGDIISGQSGAVDLTDWVRLYHREGRGMDCVDRDIAGGEEHSTAMDELLAVSVRCILPVHERPNIRQVCDDICSISV
ncbi:probable inactive receptor kinase at5g10020 [Phtheirospermum japonicum]|uniref:Probable inactive receptor kinase at5g10020 n=1 Tax=Phtheirospermum japonicum TaxID=374723 RepID=A0A830CMS4_9LAMI|nr:probable inactive receptor kinase at5g10020 [Phtheirospermum japonicum]